jgi:hypothetical protein
MLKDVVWFFANDVDLPTLAVSICLLMALWF